MENSLTEADFFASSFQFFEISSQTFPMEIVDPTKQNVKGCKKANQSRSLVELRVHALHFKLYAFISISVAPPPIATLQLKLFQLNFPFDSACPNSPRRLLYGRCYRNNNVELIFLFLRLLHDASQYCLWMRKKFRARLSKELFSIVDCVALCSVK